MIEEKRSLVGYNHSADKRQQFAQKTVLGEFRNPCRFTWVEWVFLVVSSVSMLGVLGLTAERFFFYENEFYNLTYSDSNSSGRLEECTKWHCMPDFTLSVVLLVNLAFCLFYCYDSLFRERKFELLAFIGATVAVLGYIIGNYIYDDYQGGEEIHTIKKVRLALVCVFGPINIFLASWCWWKMGYLVFTVIGSNEKLTRAYNIRSLFTTLQYFHLEIMVNVYVLSFASDGLLVSTGEKVVLTLSLFFLIGAVILGSIAIHWEVLLAAIFWYILMFITTSTCYLYKLIEVALNWSSYSFQFEEYLISQPAATTTSLVYIGIMLIIGVALGLLVSVILMINMGFVIRNFKLGLRDKVDPPFKRYMDPLIVKLT